MSDLFTPRVGAVFSADIAVPEHERELRFYSRVLSSGERPLWRAEDLMNNLGLPIIGVGARSAELAHLPLQWMPHIQVADVDASVQRALDGDGSVLMHARDEAGKGQWAVLLDPTGAAFGLIPLIPAGALPPSAGDDSPGAAAVGRITALDLTVANATTARDFYREVVGWTAEEVEMEEDGARYADYTMLDADGKPAAGICHARGANGGLPPVWMLYLPVGDLDESVRRVEEEGGTLLKVTRDGEGKVVYAAIQDPAGASFALVQG